jgi:tRNA A-37 threonylcarbamoyl transferase component Bud32
MDGIFIHKSPWRHVQVDRRYLSDALWDVLQAPDRYLEDREAVRLQANFKSTIAVVPVDGRRLVIKRHNYKSAWHRVKRLFRPTRASRSWRYARLLGAHQIRVPPPVGFVETRLGPLRGASYFLYEYVDGVRGDRYFQRHQHDRRKIDKAMAAIVDLVIRIEALGLIHGDVRVANLIFAADRIWLLDFDDMRPIRWYQSSRVRRRDLRGLRKDIHYNIPDCLQAGFYRRLDRLEASRAAGRRLPRDR